MNKITFNFERNIIGIYNETQTGEQFQDGLSERTPEILHELMLEDVSPSFVAVDFETGTVTADGVEFFRPDIIENVVLEAAGMVENELTNIPRIMAAMFEGKISSKLAEALMDIECDARSGNPQVAEFLRKLESDDQR